jgi:hypothetical protein
MESDMCVTNQLAYVRGTRAYLPTHLPAAYSTAGALLAYLLLWKTKKKLTINRLRCVMYAEPFFRQ